jgi:CRP-like cAMP-binding protein
VASGNLLLDRLERLGSRIPDGARLARLELRQRIDRDGPMEQLAFPATAVVSLLTLAEGEGAIELAMVGRSGFVGHDLLLGADRLDAGTIAQVQVAGSAWMVDVERFDDLASDEPESWRVLGAAARIYHAQIRRQVLCNALHAIDQRVCRWLLTTADEVGSSRFPITQAFLSELLGVRRASVNSAQRALRDAGWISYGSGHVELLDRRAIESRACSCYPAAARLRASLLDEI